MHPKGVVKQVPGGTWNDFALLNQLKRNFDFIADKILK